MYMKTDLTKNILKGILSLTMLTIASPVVAQDDLEKALNAIPKEQEKVTATFKSTKLINLQNIFLILKQKN